MTQGTNIEADVHDIQWDRPYFKKLEDVKDGQDLLFSGIHRKE